MSNFNKLMLKYVKNVSKKPNGIDSEDSLVIMTLNIHSVSSIYYKSTSISHSSFSNTFSVKDSCFFSFVTECVWSTTWTRILSKNDFSYTSSKIKDLVSIFQNFTNIRANWHIYRLKCSKFCTNSIWNGHESIIPRRSCLNFFCWNKNSRERSK